MIIDDHTSDARTIENENNEQSLQGYKPPVGFFRWSHTRDDWCRLIVVSVGDKVRNSRVVCAVVIAEKGKSRYNI